MKGFKKFLSLVIIFTFFTSFVLPVYATEPQPDYNKATQIVDFMVTKIKDSKANPEDVASLISEYLSGEGYNDFIDLVKDLTDPSVDPNGRLAYYGVNETTMKAFLDFLRNTTYNKQSFIDLINNPTEQKEGNLAEELVDNYLSTTNIGNTKINYMLGKIYTLMNMGSLIEALGGVVTYNGIDFSMSDSQFNNFMTAINSLVLRNDIQNTGAVKSAINDFISSLNERTSNEKRGAVVFLKLFGFVNDTSSFGDRGGLIPPGETVEDIIKDIDKAVSSGNVNNFVKGIENLKETLESKIVASNQSEAEKKAKEYLEIAEDVLSKSIMFINNQNVYFEDAKKSVEKVLELQDKVVSTIRSIENLDNVKKSLLIEKEKYEIADMVNKLLEKQAVKLSVQVVNNMATADVKWSDISGNIDKFTNIDSILDNVKDSTLKKASRYIDKAAVVSVPTTQAKEIEVSVPKEVLNSSIDKLALLTEKGKVVLPLKDFDKNENVKVIIKDVDVKTNYKVLVKPLEIKVMSGNNEVAEFKNSVKLEFELDNLNDVDKDLIAAIKIKENGEEELIPVRYIETGNKVVVMRPSLSVYYITEYVKDFKDVEKGSWYEKDVKVASAKNIVKGYPDGTFKPDEKVTRAEFSKMIVNAFGLKDTGDKPMKFKDVTEKDWYYGAVSTLYNLGIVNGKSEDKFDPNAPITREEMAKIMVGTLIKLGYISDSDKIDLSNFTDASKVSDWAKKYVSIAVSEGLVNGMGDNTFAPKDGTTRAQAATIALRAFDK